MKNVTLISNVLKYVLIVLGVIAFALVLLGPNNIDYPKEEIDQFRDGGKMGFTMLFTLIIIIACAALVLLFFLQQLVVNPKRTIMSIIGIVVALLVYLVFTMMGNSDTNETLQLKNPVSESTLNSTSAGIWTVLIALVGGLLTIVVLGIMNLIKRLK